MGQKRRWQERVRDPRTLKRAGWILVLVGVLLVGIWAGRIAAAALSLQAHLTEAQALLEASPMETLKAHPEQVGSLLRGLRADVVTLRAARGLAQLGPALGWLPKVGPLLAQAGPLLDLADGLTEAGVQLWDGGAPVLQAWQAGALTPELALQTLSAGRPAFQAARPAAARAVTAYAQLVPAELPWRLQQPLTQLAPLLPWLEDGLRLVAAAPDLVGESAPRTYLLLVLNDDELRPGGGFITAVGEVELRAGHITRATVADSYTVDDFSRPYPLAPEPLKRFMGLDLLVFRDSNWSPDFPTAVAQALELYRPAHPASSAFDGVLAVDQVAVQRLVGAVGPLEVAGQTVTEESLLTYIHESWSPPEGEFTTEWRLSRKNFMGDLVQALQRRMESGLGDMDLTLVGKTVLQILDERHLQVALLSDPEAAAVLAARGWDGAVRAPQGDFLLVSEANVGYNKASAKIARSMAYAVDLTQTPPVATLTLTYTHTSRASIACVPETRWDPVYVQMMDRCYWAYLRVYAPPGSQLLAASRHPIPAAAMWDQAPWSGAAQTLSESAAHAVWGQGFLLPTGEQTVLSFTYTLPPTVLRQESEGVWVYHLDWQKQAGLRAVPVRVVLRLPQDVVWCDEVEGVSVRSDGLWVMESALQADRTVELRYCAQKEE